jgi:hypothetical protein
MFSAIMIMFISGACAGEGPSNTEVKKYLQGVYLQDVSITQRTQCALTPSMESGGHTNVWLIRYRFAEVNKVYGQLFTETDTGWEPYLLIDFCPET